VKITQKHKPATIKQFMKRIVFFIGLFLLSFLGSAQIQVPGKPASWKFGLKATIPVLSVLNRPVQKQVVSSGSQAPQPLFAGYVIPLKKGEIQRGQWQALPNGRFMWLLEIKVNQATALNLYFSHLHLTGNDRLFIYNSLKKSYLGAFSPENNGPAMGTAYLKGQNLIVELDASEQYDTLPFEISGIGNVAFTGKSTNSFGEAGSCEIPVNCPEGKNYAKQKNGVARILLRQGNELFWCTGSLINDTRNDKVPYFLTANHCGDDATPADYAQWIFYFNYESPNCSRPAQEPAIHSLSGARLLASTDYQTGSDFKLLLLNHNVPLSYKPYFNGWDRSGAISDSGVVIHHPQGDIKMISTYRTPLKPMDYYGHVVDPNANFWQVKWASTLSGHGVTEGGSSGSPLFNSDGLVIGTLTGGDAVCDNLNAADYFGRFSKHWNSAQAKSTTFNATDSTHVLSYWLDKAKTGFVKIPGLDPLEEIPNANFTSDVKKTPIGGLIRFTDLSTGPVAGYHWEFPGGDPPSYNAKTPPPVRYAKPGTYSVTLQVTGNDTSTLKTDSVFVMPVVFPNPTRNGHIHILLGSYQRENISITIFDIMGRPLNTFRPQFGNDDVTLQLPHNQNGLYIIRLTNNQVTHTYKVINYHP
jgi:hypothetical protein